MQELWGRNHLPIDDRHGAAAKGVVYRLLQLLEEEPPGNFQRSGILVGEVDLQVNAVHVAANQGRMMKTIDYILGQFRWWRKWRGGMWWNVAIGHGEPGTFWCRRAEPWDYVVNVENWRKP